MTLWIAWSVLTSALLALAAIALERASAYLGAPRRMVWLVSMVIATVLPLALALRHSTTVTPIEVSLFSQSMTTRPPGEVAPSTMIRAPELTSAASGPATRQTMVLDWSGILRRLDPWIARTWLAVSSLLFLLFALAVARLRHRQREWTDAKTDVGRVFVSHDVGPAVIGFVRPRIVIPSWALAADRTTRELLLRHEREHIRAGDTRALLAAELMLIVFPWNAALWLMAHRLRLAIEIDCDARVIRAVGNAHEYGLVLLAVGERRTARLPVAASLSEPRLNLEKRIDAMTAPRQRHPIVASLPFAAIALAVLTTAAWTPRPNPLLPARVSQTAAANVFGADPKPLRGNPTPRYPERLRDAGVDGHVLLTFSTDARGVPDTSTIRVVESTNDLFLDATRSVLPLWHFDSRGTVRLVFRFFTTGTEPDDLTRYTTPIYSIDGVKLTEKQQVVIVALSTAKTPRSPDTSPAAW